MIRQKIAFAVSTLAVCVLTVLLLVCGPYAAEAVRSALALFVSRVLPPLFPYMVLSRMIVSMDLLAPLTRRKNPARLFRLPDRAASVLLTGLLCGFPVGAAGTCTLYENGGIGRRDAGRLAALSSNTGPAFVLGTVAALWNSRAYGVFLFSVQTLSALILAFFAARRIPPDTVCTEEPGEKETSAGCGTFSAELCRGISESASACLTVCAYIVFFRVLAAICSLFCPGMAPVFGVLFEFSTGCADGASLGGYAGIFLTGFAVGSAGLCVMMQNYNYLGRHGISVKPLWLTKILQGLLCGTASAAFFRWVPLDPGGSSAVFAETFSLNAGIVLLSVLLLLSKVYKISYHVI